VPSDANSDLNRAKPQNSTPPKEIKATLHVVDDATGQPMIGYQFNLGQLSGVGKRDWFSDQVAGRWGPPKQKITGTLIQVYAYENRPLWVQITKSGYLPEVMTELPLGKVNGKSFTIRLKRGKSQKVRVYLSDGGVAANARVLLARDGIPSYYMRHNYEQRDTTGGRRFGVLSITRATTDASGQCELSGIDKESDRIAVLTESGLFDIFQLPAKKTEVFEVQMPKPTSLQMKVTPVEKFANQYLDGGRVYENEGLWRGVSVRFDRKINNQSTHQISGLPAGKYQVRRFKEVETANLKQGHLLNLQEVEIPAAKNANDRKAEVVFKHTPGKTFSGKIVNLKERGMIEASILFKRKDKANQLFGSDEAAGCGVEGSFDAELPPGTYFWKVQAWGEQINFGSISMSGQSIETNGEITIPATGEPKEFQIVLPEVKANDKNSEKVKPGSDGIGGGRAWGAMKDGLRLKAVTPRKIEQGMPMSVQIQLGSDPAKLAHGKKQLNTFMHDAYLELQLENRQTKKSLAVNTTDSPRLRLPTMSTTSINGTTTKKEPWR